MADNINNCNDDCHDEKCTPLPIDEARLKEIKAMEEAEQRLIEDLFSTPSNACVKVLQQKQTLPNKKSLDLLVELKLKGNMTNTL